MNLRKDKKTAAEKPSLRERVADTLDVSKEIVLDTARIVFIGDREVTIENYKSIIEYTSEKIELDAKPYRLRLSGSALEVKTITREMLYISGKIFKMEFAREDT